MLTLALLLSSEFKFVQISPASQGFIWIASEQTEQHRLGKDTNSCCRNLEGSASLVISAMIQWRNRRNKYLYNVYSHSVFLCRDVGPWSQSYTLNHWEYSAAQWAIHYFADWDYNTINCRFIYYNEPIRIDVYWLVIVFIADCSPSWCVRTDDCVGCCGN